MSVETVRAREEIPTEDRWNVEALYPTFESWETDYNHIRENQKPPYWPSLLTFRGHLHEGPEIVKKALDQLLILRRQIEKLYTFAHLRHDEDIINEQYKSAYQRSLDLLQEFEQEVSWFEPEILSLSDSKIKELLSSPLLKEYQFHIQKIIRLRPHILSAEKEELLALASKAFRAPPKAFSALNNADLKFASVKDQNGNLLPLSHGFYQLHLRSKDRTLRKNAYETYHQAYANLENTFCELLFGEIQTHIVDARARSYSSCLQAALYPKNIEESVYHSLIRTVRKEGLPLLHEYMGLRKQILGLDQLKPYDLYVPLIQDLDLKLSYEEAESLVIESTKALGPNYQSLLKKGMKEEKWVDRFENKNKRSGAYSSGCYDSFPYILMNYRGTVRDAFTLAHEVGHSMHSLMSRKQPYQYFHYPIFVAEVASTFNEEIFRERLLQKFSKEQEKRFLINEKLEDIRATLFRQTLFAEFELLIHELAEKGIPLTPGLLKEHYTQLYKDYYGPELVLDDLIAVEWARIPHFYYNFYVFQYATGISAALSLAEKVLEGSETAQQKYLSFLQSGGSQFPIQLLQTAGVDMTSSMPVESAMRQFKSLLKELEQSLVK